MLACLRSTLRFTDETRGLLQLVDGCSGIDSFRWQFVRLQNREAVLRLGEYRAATLPRECWCQLLEHEPWSKLLRAVLLLFIDARNGCYHGAVCLPVAAPIGSSLLQRRMLKRDLTSKQVEDIKALARRLRVRPLLLQPPRGDQWYGIQWHELLAPIRNDGAKRILTLVMAGRS